MIERPGAAPMQAGEVPDLGSDELFTLVENSKTQRARADAAMKQARTAINSPLVRSEGKAKARAAYNAAHSAYLAADTAYNNYNRRYTRAEKTRLATEEGARKQGQAVKGGETFDALRATYPDVPDEIWTSVRGQFGKPTGDSSFFGLNEAQQSITHWRTQQNRDGGDKAPWTPAKATDAVVKIVGAYSPADDEGAADAKKRQALANLAPEALDMAYPHVGAPAQRMIDEIREVAGPRGASPGESEFFAPPPAGTSANVPFVPESAPSVGAPPAREASNVQAAQDEWDALPEGEATEEKRRAILKKHGIG